MKADFVNPFLLSCSMCSPPWHSSSSPGKPKRKMDELARGDVSGLIGMVGPQTRGSLSISFEKGLALEIMRRMLGEAPATINEEVTDMVGEITNMVTGGAKRMLGRRGMSSTWRPPSSSPAPITPSPIAPTAPRS